MLSPLTPHPETDSIGLWKVQVILKHRQGWESLRYGVTDPSRVCLYSKSSGKASKGLGKGSMWSDLPFRCLCFVGSGLWKDNSRNQGTGKSQLERQSRESGRVVAVGLILDLLTCWEWMKEINPCGPGISSSTKACTEHLTVFTSGPMRLQRQLKSKATTINLFWTLEVGAPQKGGIYFEHPY